MTLVQNYCLSEQNPDSDSVGRTEKLFDSQLPALSDITFRDQVVGDRYIYQIETDSKIRVDIINANGQFSRISVELSEKNKPVLFIALDAQCQVRAARELEYRNQVASLLKILDGELNTINSEELNPAIPGLQGSAQAGIRIALIDSGVNYQLPEIFNRLARDAEGNPVGYDFWDMDDRPFDSHPVGSPFFIQHHGTQTASLLLSEAPEINLIPYRYPRPDMTRMAELIQHAADNDIRIIGMPLGSNKKQDWLVFEQEAANNPQILFIASAGNNGLDIDQTPVYPASLNLDNMIVVTSADGFLRPADRTNWGNKSVDFMLPAERQDIIRFNGETAQASGSSYAVSRMTAMAARILNQNPELSITQLIERIKQFALPVSNKAFVKYGYIPDPGVQNSTPEFEIVSIDSDEDIGQSNLKRFDVSNLLLSEQWSIDEVQTALKGANQILAQCNIAIGNIRTARLVNQDLALDLDVGLAHTLIPAFRTQWKRPQDLLLVFVRDTKMQIQFDAEAFGPGNTSSRPWMSNSVWVLLGAKHLEQVLAHEIFHVIANSGRHMNIPGNLMSEQTDPEKTELLPQQCKQTLRYFD